MDITQLILDDHHEQRRLFALLEQVDPADQDTLRAVWGRLAAFLELHAAAEEEIFYPELLRVGTSARRTGQVEGETVDAIHDHNDIRDAIAQAAPHPVGTAEWYAAVTQANVANGDHMAEEEREGLTDFRHLASLQLRHDLAVAFIRFETQHYAGVPPVDKDPEGYVRAIEEDAGAAGDEPASGGPATVGPATGGSPAGGSLNIGSLKER